MEARAEPLRETIKDETTTKRKGASRPMKTQQTRWSRISQQRTVIFDTASLFFALHILFLGLSLLNISLLSAPTIHRRR